MDEDEMNASAREIGEAMLLLKRAGARFGFGIGQSVLPRQGRTRIFQHHNGYAIDKQGRAFVAIFADGSESKPLPNKTAAIAMLPPGVRFWAAERTKTAAIAMLPPGVRFWAAERTKGVR